jgi:hypothetical protein
MYVIFEHKFLSICITIEDLFFKKHFSHIAKISPVITLILLIIIIILQI